MTIKHNSHDSSAVEMTFRKFLLFYLLINSNNHSFYSNSPIFYFFIFLFIDFFNCFSLFLIFAMNDQVTYYLVSFIYFLIPYCHFRIFRFKGDKINGIRSYL